MLTRFQIRMNQGQKIKNIMENPLVMETVLTHLFEHTNNNCHTLMKLNIHNLKMVFKSKETKYVLDKYMLYTKMDNVCLKRFYIVSLNLIKQYYTINTKVERIESMVSLFSHFVKNKDIINRKQPNIVSLKKDILRKLDRFNIECPQFKQVYGITFIKLLK
jgi:hypothetical protein